MTEFQPKDYWKVYLDKKTKERVREIQDHLDEHYDGKTDFVQKALQKEKPVSLEERIKQAEKKKKQEEERLERLRQVKRERTEQQQLEDKKELLRNKQEKLRELEGEGVNSLHELMVERVNKSLNKGYDLNEKSLRSCWANAKLKYRKQPDVDQLRSDVERLQDEVAELNGGRENWFLELESMEVSV